MNGMGLGLVAKFSKSARAECILPQLSVDLSKKNIKNIKEK